MNDDLNRGIAKHTIAFLLSTVFAILGSLMLLIGAAIWTVIIKKAQSVNDIIVGPVSAPVPLGITVSMGDALFLLWAAFACLLVSIVPYMIRYVCPSLDQIVLENDTLNAYALVAAHSAVERCWSS